jgi:hypothetical protein
MLTLHLFLNLSVVPSFWKFKSRLGSLSSTVEYLAPLSTYGAQSMTRPCNCMLLSLCILDNLILCAVISII